MTKNNTFALENVIQAVVEQYLYYQGECQIDPQNAENEAIGIAQDTVKAIQKVEKEYQVTK